LHVSDAQPSSTVYTATICDTDTSWMDRNSETYAIKLILT